MNKTSALAARGTPTSKKAVGLKVPSSNSPDPGANLNGSDLGILRAAISGLTLCDGDWVGLESLFWHCQFAAYSSVVKRLWERGLVHGNFTDARVFAATSDSDLNGLTTWGPKAFLLWTTELGLEALEKSRPPEKDDAAPFSRVLFGKSNERHGRH